MPDLRCFCEIDTVQPGELIILSPEESNHLVAANRGREGDPVRAFNGRGGEWECRLQHAHKRKAVLAVETSHSLEMPPYRIALAQALPKGKTMESIVKKATELGAQVVFPLQTRRVESKLAAAAMASKREKWTAASREAAKQSGNSFPVTVEDAVSLEGLVEVSKDYELRLIASLLPGSPSLKQQLTAFREAHEGRNPRSVLWVVGPEGDLTPQESQMAIEHGFQATNLGPHVLRCETAAVAALAIIRHEIDTQENLTNVGTPNSSASQGKAD